MLRNGSGPDSIADALSGMFSPAVVAHVLRLVCPPFGDTPPICQLEAALLFTSHLLAILSAVNNAARQLDTSNS